VTELRWYYATSRLATFAFAFSGERITVCAPFGRRWLLGRNRDEARTALRARSYRVKELDA
jgi:hypothetical protein